MSEVPLWTNTGPERKRKQGRRACAWRCWRAFPAGTCSPAATCSRVSGFGFRVSGLGFRVSGFEFRVSVFGFRVSGFGFRVSVFGFRFSGFGFRDSGFEFRVSGSGFRVSSFGFRVLDFGFQFSVFGFRFSGFGFLVSGPGFRAWGNAAIAAPDADKGEAAAVPAERPLYLRAAIECQERGGDREKTGRTQRTPAVSVQVVQL